MKLKALNAENAGAHLLIVSANDKLSAKDLIENSYDFTSMNIEIPTAVISPENASKLQSLIRKSGDVYLKFQMPIPQSNQVQVAVNISRLDSKIYAFLKSFKNYALHFENHIDINFAFFKEADHQDEVAKLQIMANCMDFENVFDMLGSFNDFCVQKKNASPECMGGIAESFDVKDYVKFEQCVNRKSKDIESVKTSMKPSSVNTHSYLTINNMLYNGSLKAENVFEAICGGFIKSPEYCLFLNNKYTANIHFHSIRERSKRHRFFVLFVNIIISVMILSLAGVALIMIFRKIYQRVLDERVADMVRDSVINYRSLKNNE